MSNVNYIVDVERGIVRAVLKGTKFDAVRTIKKVAKGTNLVSEKKYLIANSYKAIAKCNFDEGDVFDTEFGKKLALKRLMTKLSTDRANAIALYLDDRLSENDVLSDRLNVILNRLAESSENKTTVNTEKKVLFGGNSSIGGYMVRKMIKTYEKSIS